MRTAVDLFCGAGGTSSGIIKAAKDGIKLIAVNHWRTAINTHSLNHPGVQHICEPVENLHPRDLIKTGHLNLLAASCECRYHSNARGGGPCNEQSRAQPWELIRWATDIDIDAILMENVREFQNWGPLNWRTKKPIPSRKGKFFRAFIEALANLGYHPEFRIQNAADYGDPTKRQRLILIAMKRKAPWPTPSHGPGRENAHRTAREIIDWNLKGKSIFKRKKPLSANTLARLATGLRKFGGANAQPFLMVLNGTTTSHIQATTKSLDEPLPTVTTSNHIQLCEPFIQHLTRAGERRCHSIDEPLPTVTGAHRGEMALVEPFLIQTDQTGGNGCCVHKTSTPLPTIVTKQNLILCEPIVLGQQSGHNGSPVNEPLPTVAGAGAIMLCEPYIVKYYGRGENAESVDSPLSTVTVRDRFMLVEVKSGREIAEIDILVRMLQPHELSAAHSFPSNYQFTGNKQDQTKQIGNSVPVELAAAHARAIFESI